MTRKHNEHETDDEQQQQQSRLQQFITKQEVSFSRFNVHLDSEISDPSTYRDLITLLFNANENDSITIYINCPGGHLDSAMAIIEGMKITKAHVLCILLGACHSAASMIAMYAHEIVVLDAAHSLVHTATFGSIGNSNNIKTHTDFTVKQIEKFINATYAGFLSNDELTKVKEGIELWFDADEIRERMINRNAYIEKEIAKEQKTLAKKSKHETKQKDVK